MTAAGQNAFCPAFSFVAALWEPRFFRNFNKYTKNFKNPIDKRKICNIIES